MEYIIVIVITAFVAYKVYKSEKANNIVEPLQSSTEEEEPMVHEHKFFCTKDSGYYVSVWPKDDGLRNIDYIEFDIAGLTYRENIMKYMGEFEGTLEPEPTNPYDENAIKILAPDGHHVGYVPKDTTERVRGFAELPCKCYFFIGNYFDAEGTHYYSDCFITRKN